MTSKNLKCGVSLLLLLLGIVATRPAFGGSAVIGSVAGSMNATMGGQALLPNTTVFSGDSLQVNDGVAVVAVGNASRMVFGRQTTASFLKDASEVTVLLSRGNVSMYHPDEAVGLRVKVGEVTVVPAKGFKTLGEVAMVGGSVTITAKEGQLRVEGNGSALDVAKGKTITIPTQTARAPKPSPPAGGGAGGGMAWQVAGTAAAGTGAGLSALAVSRANSAKDAATAADTTAAQATAAAAAAADAADTANTTAIAVGCAIDKVTPSVKGASPFVPPTGTTCP